jgi:hypothetical protein
MVSPDEGHLKKIELAVGTSLGTEIASCVRYFLPNDFITWLGSSQTASEPRASDPAATERRGYKIKRAVSNSTLADKQAREEEAIKAMADAMRKRKNP